MKLRLLVNAEHGGHEAWAVEGFGAWAYRTAGLKNTRILLQSLIWSLRSLLCKHLIELRVEEFCSAVIVLVEYLVAFTILLHLLTI